MRVVCYVCPLTAFNHSWLKIVMGRNWSKQFVLAPAVSYLYLYQLTRIITAWQKHVLACDHSMTEVRAIPNTGFYGKFQCKSDPVIQNSDPGKRRILHTKGTCD